MELPKSEYKESKAIQNLNSKIELLKAEHNKETAELKREINTLELEVAQFSVLKGEFNRLKDLSVLSENEILTRRFVKLGIKISNIRPKLSGYIRRIKDFLKR